MNTSLYIISNGKDNEYKVGFHTGTIIALNSRYTTAIPDLKIEFFCYDSYAKHIEKIFHNKYDQYRKLNTEGRKTEWYNTFSLLEIQRKLFFEIDHIDRSKIPDKIKKPKIILPNDDERCDIIVDDGIRTGERCKGKGLYYNDGGRLKACNIHRDNESTEIITITRFTAKYKQIIQALKDIENGDD